MSPEVREVTELITSGPAEALSGLLGVEGTPFVEMPLLFHWVYLLDRPPTVALGPDGHQAVGGMPVPPGPGLRRMFAGGRAWRHGALRIGAEATRRTWQASSVAKEGRTGPLRFVTVRTEISQGGEVVVAEEQDLVYREPAVAGEPSASAEAAKTEVTAGAEAAGDGDWVVEVDPVLLFRYSALTYNAHRIHYDRDYARSEGYPGLLVHGPLQALLMAELARRSGVPASEYSYRLVSPLYDDQGLVVSAVPDGDAVRVSCRDAAGRVTATGVIG
ncbi:MAG TPA: MaoC family dehydratase N-terminal domain-containing protein [Streptosporangiaceae bacterium]|nr:MaoC family dehydratase N-terminal domain-containing protein [Streptosporangiaceae bacterium]